ncbi:metallophosphoesterase family protein [Roseimaritima ulvae]|uniref:Cyclic 3',5'-adenosine monophosphate phosphodiesterase n=1 Tax=Roseimaritima ulvae TaxID=980254 RepID=A0A5B9QQW8_9BACT|nr:metallophosphoesterase [Roseimaritima ulvae]QEG41394.1 cyclic 3',5'-adenosine monophosphate phosphodiesterase [Roseimaritima ulvae]
MPLHLLPQSRRRFLQTTLASGTTLLAARMVGAEKSEPSREWWALLSDTHIAADPAAIARGVNMFDNLNRVIDQVLAEPSPPAGVIINGDCAYLNGLAADYATLSKALQRLADAGLSVHMNMGNHDDRGPFYGAFEQQQPERPLVEGKHVSILESKFANVFLVDSLQHVNQVTGELGPSQLDWLTKALDAHNTKPAIVIGHHNLQFRPAESQERVSGLLDSQQFIDALHARPHVQAYVFGHTHNWSVRQTDQQLHLINLPPCAYVFNESRPNGWVRAEIGENELKLELRALDPKHVEHGQQKELQYKLAAVN